MLTDVHQATLDQNTLERASWAPILHDVTGLEATSNTFRDHAFAVDARHNWWGDESGPRGQLRDACSERSAEGSGERIVADRATVCFHPWLSASPS